MLPVQEIVQVCLKNNIISVLCVIHMCSCPVTYQELVEPMEEYPSEKYKTKFLHQISDKWDFLFCV